MKIGTHATYKPHDLNKKWELAPDPSNPWYGIEVEITGISVHTGYEIRPVEKTEGIPEVFHAAWWELEEL